MLCPSILYLHYLARKGAPISTGILTVGASTTYSTTRKEHLCDAYTAHAKKHIWNGSSITDHHFSIAPRHKLPGDVATLHGTYSNHQTDHIWHQVAGL
jgi:hypothetical protein